MICKPWVEDRIQTPGATTGFAPVWGPRVCGRWVPSHGIGVLIRQTHISGHPPYGHFSVALAACHYHHQRLESAATKDDATGSLNSSPSISSIATYSRPDFNLPPARNFAGLLLSCRASYTEAATLLYSAARSSFPTWTRAY